MKVIAKGTPRGDRVCIFSCNHCGAVVQAAESEGKRVMNTLRIGSHVQFFCPECSGLVRVDSSKFTVEKRLLGGA